VTARLKWPNDIVFDGRKLAGILCEGASGASGTFVVAGIGINVRQAKEDLPLDLRTPGTSLRIITGRETARPELASALLDALRPFRLRGEIGPDTLAEYRTYDALLGRIVTLDDGTTGTARGIDANGALLFETDEGIRTLRSGSVRTFTQHSTTGLP
jgi:BirA family biotin operon repressor/biotin-[acetyl-CoA-carboxylase] ligase